MSYNKIIEYAFIFSTLLSGFYAGTGFFIAMGGNPSIKLMSDKTFAEYWQITDHYMAARMKFFGPLLILSILLTVLLLLKTNLTTSLWFMLLALGILVTDMIFIFTTNYPLNSTVQEWDLDKLPSNVKDIKWRIVKAFTIRTYFMICSFVMVLLAVWFYKKE